jgi:isoleucyl-tRNA synthetase
VRSALAAGDYTLGDDGVVHVGGEQLAVGEYELRSRAREGFEAQTDGALVAAIDTRLTDELQLEGTARDIVRFLQNVRKELGFDVSDRIAVRYAADERGSAVLEAHGASIAREVLAERFEPGEGGEHLFSAGGAEIAFGVARA